MVGFKSLSPSMHSAFIGFCSEMGLHLALMDSMGMGPNAYGILESVCTIFRSTISHLVRIISPFNELESYLLSNEQLLEHFTQTHSAT